ncbi:MAG TPA: hypothetical protein VF006_04770 [Longimicrobium sp.]
MPPPPVVTSLDEVSTGYTVFESDQVLTHTQLNSVAQYADDQIRLSRARLSGVGVACGLRASFTGGAVRVTGGVGITTDGDLLYLDGDTVYDRFQVYDQTYPAYPPLYRGGDVNAAMFPAYELVPQGTEGEPGRPLSQFAAVAGRQPGQMTAVLLMESYRQGDDLCSGTDCDNLGARAVNTRKLLLVGPDTVAALRGGASTPAQAYGGLPEMAAERPVLAAGLATTDALTAAYRTACNAIHARLVDALPRIYPVAGGVLGDVVSEASGASWTARLTAYRTAFSGGATGIQYYYDFLKDVVEAYNEFRERLFGDQTWCSPPITSFPKHLLLGDLAAAGASDVNRTGFYPSPVTSRTAGELEHARFLVQRLDALINHFQVSTASTLAVRVTPSFREDRPLEDRAIPFYYAAGGADPLHMRWSWRLSRRGAQAQAYGYHAAAWAAAGSPAANPLAFQIGRFDFFRVEGVVGKPVATALEAVQEQIDARNLPFAVRAVLLGTDRTRVIPRRRGTTDLHHLHTLIRRDTDERLQEAEAFTLHYSGQILHAADEGELFHAQEEEARVQVRGATASKTTELRSHAATARTRVSGGYAQYSLNPAALQQGMSSAIQAAADLSFQAAPVATTGFFNPLDNLAAGTQTTWLPWLDEIIGWKEEKKDERLLWSRFAADHPQTEHFGGVPRGGTLVLLHDAANTVVAEVMLPYHLEEEPVEEDEPVLTTPPVRPPVVRTPPVRTVPTPKRTFEREWVFRKPELDVVFEARNDLDRWVETETEHLRSQVEWQNEFIQQGQLSLQNEVLGTVGRTYDTLINNQWSTMASATERYTAPRTGDLAGTVGLTPERATTTFQDRMLGVMVEEARVREEKVTVLTELAAASPQDRAVTTQLEAAQAELGKTLEETAGYLAQSGAEVTLGSEAYVAVAQMSKGMATLSGSTVLAPTLINIDSALSNAPNVSVEVAVKAAMPKLR